jgi:hypothetical protein
VTEVRLAELVAALSLPSPRSRRLRELGYSAPSAGPIGLGQETPAPRRTCAIEEWTFSCSYLIAPSALSLVATAVSAELPSLSNREIGQRLYLSHRTISTHLYRVFPRSAFGSRGEDKDSRIDGSRQGLALVGRQLDRTPTELTNRLIKPSPADPLPQLKIQPWVACRQALYCLALQIGRGHSVTPGRPNDGLGRCVAVKPTPHAFVGPGIKLLRSANAPAVIHGVGRRKRRFECDCLYGTGGSGKSWAKVFRRPRLTYKEKALFPGPFQ